MHLNCRRIYRTVAVFLALALRIAAWKSLPVGAVSKYAHVAVRYQESTSKPTLTQRPRPHTLTQFANNLGDLENDSSSEQNTDLESFGESFSFKTTLILVGGQSLLALLAILMAKLLGTPNWGLGVDFRLDLSTLSRGCITSLPLIGFAAALEAVEAFCSRSSPSPIQEKIKASLAAVRKASQKSVLFALGPTFRPIMGLFIAVLLGAAAGIGEEWLFRGKCDHL